MRTTIATVLLAGAVSSPAWAQTGYQARYSEPNQGGRYSAEAQQVPPGFLPPPGQCRVWYDGRPPGHQAPATTCSEAERVARRDRAARVIYGGDRDSRYAERRPAFRTPAFEQGFRDGRSQGWNDRDDDKRYDPTRDDRYRSADRGYERRDGDRDAYRREYRDGFRAGYAEGYRGVMATRRDRDQQ
jgi:hypothetical protein